MSLSGAPSFSVDIIYGWALKVSLILQWVSIFLVVCAILFYTPRAIWLMAEGGLMKYLAKGATTKIVEDADKKREALLKTFQVCVQGDNSGRRNLQFTEIWDVPPSCLGST